MVGPLLAPWLFRRAPPRFVATRYLLGDDAAEAEIEALQRAIGSVAPAVLASRAMAVCRVDVGEQFAALRMPVLYLAGSRDRLVGDGAVRHLRNLRPTTEVCTLDAPHLVLQRRPHEAARLISTFFEKADAVQR